MEITAERRKELERKLVETIIQALENDILTADDVPTVSSYILDNMPGVKTQDQLLQFLRDLSAKWAIFSNLLVIESGEVQLAAEQAVAQNVMELTKSGNIEQALSMAKAATENAQKTAVPVVQSEVATQPVDTNSPIAAGVPASPPPVAPPMPQEVPTPQPEQIVDTTAPEALSTPVTNQPVQGGQV
jgi:hypothetical protein